MAEGPGAGARWEDNESPLKGPTLSTSTSSFEPSDPHDPNLSRLATATFQRCGEYLQGELAAGLDHYRLLDEMNRLAATKYTDMRHIAANLQRTLAAYNETHATHIEPYLRQVDLIEENVGKLEQAAYRLDNYTKQLHIKFKNISKR